MSTIFTFQANQAVQQKEGFFSEKNIVDALSHLVKQQSAPNIELDVFDGNPLDFHYFIILFKEIVKKRIYDPQGERLARLLKYTIGNVKEMIKHCVQEPTMGYQHAKKILVEKYGNPYHVMVEYKTEINTWPIIRSGDAEGYQTFYNSLQKCESITQSAQWNQLDTPDVICKLLAKLPGLTSGKIWKSIPCYGRIEEGDQGLANYKKW